MGVVVVSGVEMMGPVKIGKPSLMWLYGRFNAWMEKHRKLYCIHYDKCLDLAIENKWPCWSCNLCNINELGYQGNPSVVVVVKKRKPGRTPIYPPGFRCLVCGDAVKIKAAGLCSRCYAREKWRRKKVLN